MEMKILSAAAITLLLLAGCSTTPDPTPSHPTWCTKDPKKEPHTHDCEDILPAHLPEECRPEEKLTASKSGPIKQEAPDPIVGAYHVYSLEDSRESVLRLYPNGSLILGYIRYRWRYEKGAYIIFFGDNDRFRMNYQKARGEPELVTLNDAPIYGQFEALQVSANPDFLFDVHELAIVREDRSSMACFNLGRKEYRYQEIPKELGYPSFDSSSVTDCEASCRPFRDGRKELKDKRCPGEVAAKPPEPDPIVGTYRVFYTDAHYAVL